MALSTVRLPEEADGGLWHTARTGESGTAAGVQHRAGRGLSKRDSNFMLEQGNVALARLSSRNAPARLVPGAGLLEAFSTLMRGSSSARTIQVFMRRY